MKKYILALTIAVVSALAAKPANAQTQNSEKPLVVFLNGYRVEAPVEMPEKNTLVFNKMTKRDYRSNPVLLDIKEMMKFDSDVNIIVIDSLFRHSDPAVPDTLKQTLIFEGQNYEGFYAALAAGVNAEWNMNKESAIPNRWGGMTSLTCGYSSRYWGAEVTGSLSTIMSDEGRELGYTSVFVKPYLSLLRDKLGMKRLDLGVILGTQQAPAEVFSRYQDTGGYHWGTTGNAEVHPCRVAGAFMKFSTRPYMSRWQFFGEVGCHVKQTLFEYEDTGYDVTSQETIYELGDVIRNVYVGGYAQFGVRMTFGPRRNNFK